MLPKVGQLHAPEILLLLYDRRQSCIEHITAITRRLPQGGCSASISMYSPALVRSLSSRQSRTAHLSNVPALVVEVQDLHGAHYIFAVLFPDPSRAVPDLSAFPASGTATHLMQKSAVRAQFPVCEDAGIDIGNHLLAILGEKTAKLTSLRSP